MSQTATILQQTKLALIEHGWTREPAKLNPPYQGICVGIALRLQEDAFDIQERTEAFIALNLTRKLGAEPCQCAGVLVSTHNDRCLRSLDDALDWLDRAASFSKEFDCSLPARSRLYPAHE